MRSSIEIRGRRIGVCSVAFLMTIAAVMQPALAQTDALVAHLLAQTGRSKGVACVPRCGDGALAIAVAQQSGMVVLAMDLSEASVATTQAAAYSAGLLGKKLYAVTGDIAAIALGTNNADLLIVEGATDAGLAGISRAEILRVLTPYNGTAFIGSRTGGLTQGALQTWANGFGVSGVTVTSDSYGVWARITKPALAGADNWEHRYHGPGNNVVSSDTALKHPLLTQWMGKPYHDVSYNSEVHVANGRVLTMGKMWDGGYGYTIRMNTFYMRSAYNGEVLWTRNLPLRYLTGFGAAVMKGDSVFVMVGDSVAILNAETGAIKRRIGFTGLIGGIRRIAILDNVLVALAGEADMSADFPATVTDKILTDSVFYGGHLGIPGRHPPHSWGTELAAYDLAARQPLWRHVESMPIDLNHLALHENKVVFYARNSRAAALDLRTGAQVWQNNTAAFLAAVAIDSSIIPSGYDAIDAINAQCNLVAHDGRVFIATGRSDSVVALSADNGSMVWRVRNGVRSSWLSGSPYAQMVLGDTLYNRDALLNTTTGTRLGPYQGSAPGCGVFTAAPGTIYGQLGISYNLTTRAPTPGLSSLHHAVCDVGSFVANGVYFTSSFKCRCSMPSRGYKAMGSAGGYAHNQIAVESERLTQSADLTVAQQLSATAQDWFAYRGDNQRTGSSPVTVSTTPYRRFTFAPGNLYYTNFSQVVNTYDVDWRIAPPVAVGDYVFTGGWDGVVRCVNTTTGLQEWQFAAGGAIASPPAVWEGRVFFGSCDGYAYACEARSGRLLWKFRAAPAQRLIMQHGMLSSTWPVTGGVLVHDSVAYVAAGGVNAENGTHVYALNARTGRIIWQNNSLAALPSAQNSGRTAAGGMVIAGGRLWLSTNNRGTFSLRLADGVLVPGACDDEVWPGKAQGLPGADIAVFRDRFVMYGGRFFWSDHSERTGTEEFGGILRYAIYTFLELDGSGNARYPEVAPYTFENGVLPPVWDSDVMVLAKDGITGVRGWDAAAAETFFTQQRTANAGTSYGTIFGSRVINDTWTSRWGPLNILVNAMAVAQNAVVIAYRDNDNADWGNWKERLVAARWKVGLFSKQNGALLWSDSLPVEPLRGGLCIDRSGNIVVALRDGRLVCFGTDQVHVAGVDASMPVLTDRELRRETAAGSWTTVHAAPAVRETHAPATLPAVDATQATEAVAAVARPGARGVQPLWEVASNAHVDDTVVVLGAASQPEPVDPADYGITRDMTWRSERSCAAVVGVSSSSSGALHGPSQACDGDLTTRWSALSEGTQTLTYDLGTIGEVDGVTLVWYSLRASRTELTVAVSADGRRWNEVDKGELLGRGTRETYRSFLPERARFVRITLEPGAGQQVCDIFETGIHSVGTSSAHAAER